MKRKNSFWVKEMGRGELKNPVKGYDCCSGICTWSCEMQCGGVYELNVQNYINGHVAGKTLAF